MAGGTQAPSVPEIRALKLCVEVSSAPTSKSRSSRRSNSHFGLPLVALSMNETRRAEEGATEPAGLAMLGGGLDLSEDHLRAVEHPSPSYLHAFLKRISQLPGHPAGSDADARQYDATTSHLGCLGILQRTS